MRGACERTVRLLAGNHAVLQVSAMAESTRAAWYANEAVLSVDGTAVATWGILTPAVTALFGLEGTFTAAELLLRPLYANFPPEVRAQALPSFPSIERDLSAILPETATWSSIEALVHGLALPCFESLGFVGTYRGKQTGAGRKSVTMRLTFRAHDRTLKREDAEAAMQALAAALQSQLAAEIRA
jgi:phenylalanyl-tRNA synthetase beta chain